MPTGQAYVVHQKAVTEQAISMQPCLAVENENTRRKSRCNTSLFTTDHIQRLTWDWTHTTVERRQPFSIYTQTGKVRDEDRGCDRSLAGQACHTTSWAVTDIVYPCSVVWMIFVMEKEIIWINPIPNLAIPNLTCTVPKLKPGPRGENSASNYPNYIATTHATHWLKGVNIWLFRL